MIERIRNNDEKIVYGHLVHRGYTNIEYEPDGNITPDFLINSTIAVEVRCLNQNYTDNKRTKGYEEVAIPLWHKVKNLLENYCPPPTGGSWFVNLKFSRPVEPWKTLKPKIHKGLENFISLSFPGRSVIAKGQGFELEVMCQTQRPYPAMFVMGGCIDQDSSGSLLFKMETNIMYCVREKEQKIENVRPKYSKWWLVLVDHIGYSLNDLEREMFREKVSIRHNWDKVILIDPRNYRPWFEI